MELITIDTETTIYNEIGKNKGRAFWPDNKIVLSGIKYSGYDVDVYEGAPPVPDCDAILVGQNIKFDLHHLRKADEEWWDWVMANNIWDTMVAEYLLTAQRVTFASLDYLAEKYGGTLKNDKIKEYWDNGVQTEDIPREELEEYLIGDVKNTTLIAEAQMKEADRLNMLPLCNYMMRSVVCTADMEWNGLSVDVPKLERIGEQLFDKVGDILVGLEDEILDKYPELDDVLNLNSPQQLSALIFGGTIKYKVQEKTGEYKTGAKAGEPKYKNIEKELQVNYVEARAKQEWYTATGAVSTSDEVLDTLSGNDFIDSLRELRFYNKQYNTYIEGLKKLIYPDNKIHHNLNHVKTVTGRLTGTEPNSQNIPSQKDSEIKGYFISGYDDGWIIQADYSQLEVVWLAHASGDKNMQRDIINNVDFHCKRLALKLGEPYDKVFKKCKIDNNEQYLEMRKKIKEFSFQRSYGAGSKSIAASTGMDEAEIKEIIKLEEQTYPQLTKFYNDIKNEVENSKVPLEKNEHGHMIHVGFYRSPTGRVYHFKEHESPDWLKSKGVNTSFTPTIIKNYPIQGGATGDLMQTVMAVLHRRLYNLGYNCKMINQVHDSIIFDCSDEDLKPVLLLIKRTMENGPRIMNDVYNINFTLPLKCDIEYGRNWKELNPWPNK